MQSQLLAAPADGLKVSSFYRSFLVRLAGSMNGLFLRVASLRPEITFNMRGAMICQNQMERCQCRNQT
jgi:hypothetical protein